MKAVTLFLHLFIWCLLIITCFAYGAVPKITPFEFKHGLKVGDRAGISCFPSQGNPPLRFRWLKDGIELKPSDRIKIRADDTDTSLKIENIAPGDSAKYTCRVTNDYGSEEHTATLLVRSPITFLIEPQDVSANVGDKLVVPCRATGSPEPIVVWSSMDSKQVTVENGNLIFDRMDASKKGRYRCEASNGAGDPISKIIDIRVNVPAKFMEKFQVTNAKRGESARLECTADGDSPLTVTWFRERIRVERSEKFDITDTQSKDRMKSELTIHGAAREDAGMYVCVAENPFGKDEKTNKLVVLEVPAAPTALTLREVWSRSASIAWAAPFTPNIPIAGFIIQFWRKSVSGENTRLQEEQISSSHTSYLLQNLQPGAHYEANLLAVNDVGRGPVSTNLRFKTGEEAPSAAPLDVFADPEGPTTIRVSWKSLPNDEWNGNPVGFYVGYRLLSDSGRPHSLKTVPYSTNSSNYEHFLSQLSRGTQYSIIVKAFNSAGTGPESVPAMATTMTGDLPPAPKVTLVSYATDSVSLMFRMRRDELPNLRLSGFSVHCRAETASVWKEVSIPVDMTRGEGSYVVKDLLPNTIYFFYVTAVSHAGHGDPSELLTIKTRGIGAPALVEGPFTPGDHPPVMFGGVNQKDVQTFVSIGAVVIVLLTIIISFVCVKKAKLGAQKPPVFADYADYVSHGKAGEPGTTYVGQTMRFVDQDSTSQLLMQGNMAIRHPTLGHEMRQLPPQGKKQPWGRPLPRPNDPNTFVMETDYDNPL